MNEWSSAIWAGISAMTAALILGLVVVLGNLASESAQIQQDQDNAVRMIKEFRQYNHFDGQEVLAQDVISAIGESRGMPEIDVYDPSTVTVPSMIWDETSLPDDFKMENLETDFDVSAHYLSSLIRSANGEVTHIEFRRVP